MTSSEQRVWSNLPVSPGSVLKEEIDYRGISHGQLSAMMGCSQSLIENIINEQTPVTAKIADDIENALGINSQIWLNLEAGFRATIAHNELVAREGPDHPCDLGQDCPARQNHDDEDDDEDEYASTSDEQSSRASILRDEGE